MLVATDDFAHLGRLTELAGLGPAQVDARPASATVQLFTEYGYLESTLEEPSDPEAPTTRDTPDVVVFVTGPRRVLLMIEAKLFDRPTRAELGQQLTAQAMLCNHLARDRGVAAGDVAQVLLLPEALAGELMLEPEALPPGWPDGIWVLTWERLLAAYQPVAPAYWAEVLHQALTRYEELKAPRRPSRHNAEAMRTGQAMVDGYRDGTLAGSWMGCGGGLDSNGSKSISPPACGAPSPMSGGPRRYPGTRTGSRWPTSLPASTTLTPMGRCSGRDSVGISWRTATG